VETLDAAGAGSFADMVSKAGPAFATVGRSNDDLAAILYTSGTTGRSKGAMLSHDNLASNAFTLRKAWRFSGTDVLLHALPIFHTHGLFVATNVVLASGASMIFQSRFDPNHMVEALPHATVMMGVPTFYIRLLQHPGFNRALVSRMRLFISGSAPLPADVHREFQERTGHAILERYGMTETNMNTSNPYDGDRIAGTVGLPLPGVEIRITDPQTGRALPEGDVGMIEIRGPNVFKGYWRMPERTEAEFRGDYFVSGDLGRIDELGYVSIVGREKDLIIAGGYNIYPAEVENVIGDLPQVQEVAVVGLPHPDLGETVVAVVVPTVPDYDDAGAINTAISHQIARFKQPRRVLFVNELPKNAMGKVQKAVLRERYADLFTT
jgi:malonyl-CoA/methylmalonyl-CoA synthetase